MPVRRDRVAQRVGGRVRITAQPFDVQRAQGLRDGGRGRVRIFVGVELYQIADLRLLARSVSGDGVDRGAEITFHGLILILSHRL